MLPPELEAKYDYRGVLGQGAMGRVLDAMDRVMERPVAIKLVDRPRMGDAEAEEGHARFRREAQATGRLSHPNIVGVYEYGENQTTAWIVMEQVSGGTLKSRFDRQERFPVAEIARLMGQVLAALAYSHSKGVIHRDIKPANIMLAPGPDGQAQVKIADFGIARLENSSMTQVGTMMGTPSYMAPEQFRGEVVDERADIWAAGVVLYQFLTGEKPFEGGFSAVMHKALNIDPPPPSRLSVTAPAALDAVVARSMAKRPADRYPSATAFADALRAALAGAVSGAGQPEGSSDATMIAAPRGGPAPGASKVGPQAAPKSGSNAALFAGGAIAAALVAGVGAWFWLSSAPPAPPSAPPIVASPAPSPAVPPVVASPAPPPSLTLSTPPSAIVPPIASAPVLPSPSPSGVVPQAAAPVPLDLRPVPTPEAPQASPPEPVPVPTGTPVQVPQPAAPAPIVPPQTAPTAPAPAPVLAPAAPVPAAPASPAPVSPPVADSSRVPPVTSMPAPMAGPVLLPAPPAPPAAAPRVDTGVAPPAPTLPVPTLPQAVAPPAMPLLIPAQPPAAPALAPVPPAVAPPTVPVLVAPPSIPAPVAPPVAIPAPMAPPAPPAEPSPAERRLAHERALAAAQSAVPCSILDGEANEHGVAIGGILQRGGELALRAALRAGGLGDAAQRLDVQVFDGPYCGVLDTLRPFAKTGARPQASIQGRLPLSKGELLKLAVTMPEFSGELTISYLMPTGDVAHLVAPRREAAGARQRFGEPQGAFTGWEIDEPFGTDLILVIASERPLFAAPRPQVEPIDAYRAALATAAAAAQAAGTRLGARLLVLETVARRP